MQASVQMIRGGMVLLPDGRLEPLDIAVAEGRIAALLPPGTATRGAHELDARGLVVMPGALDVHIHLGHGADIAQPRVAADAETESAAAAAGGVTTFISYLLSSEAYEAQVFERARAVAQAGSRVDFGFHFIITTDQQLASVPRYVRDYGVPTFKLFMYNRAGEGARLGLPDIDDGFLFRLCEAAAGAGGMVCPHPENIEVIRVLRERLLAADPEGRGSLQAWNDSRPPFVEAEAVGRVATLARAAGAPLYIVHCSSGEALDAAVRQRAAGGRLFIESCIQYLTHDTHWEGGDVGKVNPPLRDPPNREQLWQALGRGDIDVMATDHVHRDVAGKAGGIWKAAPGFPGMETLLPVLLSEGHHKRGIALGAIADVVSANPARIMGCGQKGAVAVGKDADLACVDLDARWTVERARLHSDAGFSLYEGWTLRGKVVHTLVRGGLALRDGALVPAAIGQGRYLHRALTPFHASIPLSPSGRGSG